MVTHLHSHCLCSLRKFGYNDAVELRGGRITADMVMHRDNIGRIIEYPEAHDDPINEEIPIELLVLANFMHKNRVGIENLGNFSLKILGIFVSLPQKSRFMYYQRLIEDAIALKLKSSGAVLVGKAACI